MRTTTNFRKENAKGNVGEQVFMDLMADYPVVDVRLDREYQRKDIDFLIYDKSYEVKSCGRISDTGNMALELYIDRRGERIPGYFNVTEADVLIYVDVKSQIVYRVDMEELRELVDSKPFNIKKYSTNDGGTYKTMTLLVVPIEEIGDLPSFVALDYVSELIENNSGGASNE